MTCVTPEVRELLEQHPWEDTIPRLKLYTRRKAKRLYWQGIVAGHMPCGKEADDIVQEAIADLFTGTRRWDPAKLLFEHLLGIVDSKLNHLAESWENRHILSESMLTPQGNDTGETTFLERFATSVPSPSEASARAEEEHIANEFLWAFYEFLNDDPLLQKIMECMLDGVTKPAEISTRVGADIKVIHNAQKRLSRRLDHYREKQSRKPLPTKGARKHGST